jgi:hypothetical protein
MKSAVYKNWFLVFGFWLLASLSSNAFGQSTNQSFPTPISSNEISGTIKARDLGDARLTSYFYVFNGNQGDVFINVVTKNLDGDIDIFTADNLKPLTKITVYSDNSNGETGRVVYLRQPQKLILRIEGKTPIDDPATFRIKFAGSFEAIQSVAENEEPETPQVKNDEQGEVRVNSVGTIIEVKPKPTPKPKETIAKLEKPKKETEKVETEEKTEEPKETKPEVAENTPTENKTEEKPVEEKETPKTPVKEKKPIRTKKTKPQTTAKTEPKPKVKPEKTTTVIEPALLENIRLIVLFKDGTKIERPMSEILKVSVDKGILTVISKDGTIGRYSILDVAKMTIE